MAADTPGPLAALPSLLRDEPGVTRALSEPQARLAIVEVARPISIAALAGLSNRRPLVVACPTGAMAGRMYDDLCQFLGTDAVAHFPAWETLPFERVSPAVETMGQRLEVLWRLRDSERCPQVIVAGVRALLQKLGPGAVDVEPIVIRPRIDRRSRSTRRPTRRVRISTRRAGRAPRRVRPPRRDRRRLPVHRRRPDPDRSVG